MNVGIQNAVIAAQNFFKSLENRMGGQVQDLRLEEVELSDDKKYWSITLGFSRATDSTNNPLGIPGIIRQSREYKTFKIDSETGEVQSMKIREV